MRQSDNCSPVTSAMQANGPLNPVIRLEPLITTADAALFNCEHDTEPSIPQLQPLSGETDIASNETPNILC